MHPELASEVPQGGSVKGSLSLTRGFWGRGGNHLWKCDAWPALRLPQVNKLSHFQCLSLSNHALIQCSAEQYSAVQSSTVHYSAVQCSTVQYRSVQCTKLQCSTMQYSALQCSTMRWRCEEGGGSAGRPRHWENYRISFWGAGEGQVIVARNDEGVFWPTKWPLLGRIWSLANYGFLKGW